MTRPPITLIQNELGLGRGPAARLAATGLVESLADLRALAARPYLLPHPGTLVVSLGPLTELDPEQRIKDGAWRRYIGWARSLSPDDTERAAAAWWPASRIPDGLVAVTTGGFVVGAWKVEDIADIRGGRYWFTLGAERRKQLGGRVKVTPGPVARWLEE